MGFHLLPVANRAFGTPDPANDMDAVLNALKASGTGLYFVDDYSADPTSAALSDAAFTQCFGDAQSYVSASSIGGSSATYGAVVVMGGGGYTVSPGIIATTDSRIGLIGRGKAATLLRTTGSGIIASMRGGSQPGTPAAAPVGGFSLYGWDAGANTTGLRFGDRPYGTLFDVYFNGFGNTGDVGLQIAGTGVAVAEGVDAWGLVAKSCTVGMSIDGTLGGTSADYSRWKLHAIDNNVALQMINGGHIAGGQFHLTGTAGSANWATPTVFVGGNSGSDTWNLQNCVLSWGMEINSGSTTVTDMVLQGTAASGIQNCNGNLMFLNAGAAATAGSITTSRFSFNGSINGSPLLNTLGLDARRTDLALAISHLLDAVQVPTTGSTILTATHGRYGVIPVNPAGAVTGVILEKPSSLNTPGPANGAALQVTIVNRSAFSITFAASGTSFVADGASDVIAASRSASYVYDTGTALWYRS